MGELKTHTHKYYRDPLPRIVKSNSWIIYKCAKLNCMHTLERKFVAGKESLCWDCNQPFVITKAITARRGKSKPTCGCKKRKEIRSGGLSLLKELLK